MQYLRLSSLKSLKLRELSLYDAHLKHLIALSALAELDLGKCAQITDIGIATLCGLPNLKTLNLEGCTQISPVGLKSVHDQIRINSTRREFMSFIQPASTGQVLQPVKVIDDFIVIDNEPFENEGPRADSVKSQDQKMRQASESSYANQLAHVHNRDILSN